MIDAGNITNAELRKLARAAVIREIGIVGYLKVLRDIVPPSGDWVMEREKYLAEYEDLDKMLRDGKALGDARRKRKEEK